MNVKRRLGGGVFSDTYAARWKGRRVAAKRINVGHEQSEIKAASNSQWIVDNVAILRFIIRLHLQHSQLSGARLVHLLSERHIESELLYIGLPIKFTLPQVD